MSEKGSSLKFLPVTVFYLVLAFFYSMERGLHFVAYLMLAPCLIYLFYSHDQKHIKSAGGLLLVFLFLLSPIFGKLALFYYGTMGLLGCFIIERVEGGHFKKLMSLILAMVLLSLLFFALFERFSEGPKFFELLNRSLTDQNMIKEINEVLQKNMGREAIDFSTIDKESLRVGLSSVFSILVFDVIGFVTAINYWAMASLMSRRNPAVPRPKALSEMDLPRKGMFVLFLLFLLTYATVYIVGNFAYGILLVLLIVLYQLYILQGIFVISFLLNRVKLPKGLHIPALIVLVMVISVTKIGSLLIFNLGIADAVFNLRKLPRRSNEG